MVLGMSQWRYVLVRKPVLIVKGDKCIYKHALPPGYVLKSQKKEEDEEEKITLEQFIETARHQLPPSTELKPVTVESFAEWHTAKKKAEEDADFKRKELAKERGTGITGREFFQSGEYQGDEEEEDGEDWDLSEFRKELEDAMQQGEAFQLGNGNPQIDQQTVGEEGSGQENDRI
jgi:DRG Family Regulatory Proteins, Tma46